MMMNDDDYDDDDGDVDVGDVDDDDDVGNSFSTCSAQLQRYIQVCGDSDPRSMIP